MPSSAVRSFSDPDEYAASSRAAKAELSISQRGQFSGKHTRIKLHHLQMQRFFDNLPRIGYWANLAEDAVISFRTQAGPSLRSSGAEMLESNLIRRSVAQEYFQHSAGLAHFGSVSLPVDVMAAVGGAMVGCDLKPPKDPMTVTPSPGALRRLKCLHATAGQLAEDAPAVLAQPEAAWSLEQALIEALVACLASGEVHEDTAALRQHKAIMRRFHDATEQHLDQPLYSPELCAEIGVSERTLRVCCQEHLGMSPKRYLLMRRMHMARRALRESGPTETTVTEIATRYGFWQLGRFAGEYKALFGESPSAILARSLD
jgi:AraC-like DNA-binding protein